MHDQLIMWITIVCVFISGCGELRTRFTEINLWINSGGAQSVLHKDSPNTINCVVNGSKEWKLFEFKYNDLIYQAWEGPQEAG